MVVHDLTWGSIQYLLLAARWTLILAAIAFIGGGIGGLLLAIARTSPWRIVRMLAAGFIQIIEGIPLLMLLFLFYFGVALTGLRLDAWTSVSIALSFYASAFLADIWSGCIRTVPSGQWQAARSLALGYVQSLRLVILPQAVRIAVPPTVGFLVQLIKGTALASMVGFVELTRAGQILNNMTFKPFVIYVIVAAIYFAICAPLSMWSRLLEARLKAPYRT
ncbi:MAG: amino acid ABC transporter permease [Alphaproteobacteria bacterium]|nr:amino acid ABC transporter permease [Alphaproteobacteria bacterium]